MPAQYISALSKNCLLPPRKGRAPPALFVTKDLAPSPAQLRGTGMGSPVELGSAGFVSWDRGLGMCKDGWGAVSQGQHGRKSGREVRETHGVVGVGLWAGDDRRLFLPVVVPQEAELDLLPSDSARRLYNFTPISLFPLKPV